MWLPDEEWVMERWMPFDEDRLLTRLRISRVELYTRLKLGNQSIGQIAQGRRIAVTAGFLVQPLRGRTSRANFAVLRSRARRVLTQRHLAEHMIGHQYHHWAIWRDPTSIWGPSFRALRDSGLDAPAISARVDVGREELARRILSALDTAGRRGLALGAMPHSQARRLQAAHRENIAELVGSPTLTLRASARRGSDYRVCLLRSGAM